MRQAGDKNVRFGIKPPLVYSTKGMVINHVPTYKNPLFMFPSRKPHILVPKCYYWEHGTK